MFKEKAQWINGKIFSIVTTPKKDAAKKWVVFCPGSVNGVCSHPENGPMVSMARTLANKNVASVRFDYRGKGNSLGSCKTYDYNSAIRDIGSVVKFISSEFDATDLRIYAKGGGCYAGGAFAMKNILVTKALLFAPILAPAKAQKTKKLKVYFTLKDYEWLPLKGTPLYGRHSRVMTQLPSLDKVTLKNTKCQFLITLGKKDYLTSWTVAEQFKKTIQQQGGMCELDKKPGDEHDEIEKATIEYLVGKGVKFLSG